MEISAPAVMEYTAHCMMGHIGKCLILEACKHLGIEIQPGTAKNCKACTIGKVKQKSVPKNNDVQHVRAELDTICLYMDLSTIKKKANMLTVSTLVWRMIVDDCMEKKVSHFFKMKDDMVKLICEC